MTDTTPDHTLRPLSPDDSTDTGSQNGSDSGPANGPAEKHGGLFGGALTEEVLASSRRVLSNPRGNKNATVGLQQWFSPPEAAQLIAGVMADRHGAPGAVLDPTAGAGALLEPFPAEKRFGIEIDVDHVPDPGADPDQDGLSGGVLYRGIRGDAQKVVPMLRAAGVRFPAIVLNPPFGLGWRDAAHAKGGANGKAGKEINSTALAYLWALDLLQQFGQGAMICGTDRLAKEVLSRPEGRGVYAVADVQGPLFPGVALPTSIVFFVRPDDLGGGLSGLSRGSRDGERERPGESPAVPPAHFAAAREDLPDLADAITAARDARANYVSTYARLPELKQDFRAVEIEHDRRRRAARSKKVRSGFDLDLRGNKVSVGLSAYTRLALSNAARLREVELLKNNHVSYFAQNKRAWRQLETLEAEGLISVSPALREAAGKAVEEAEALATPLFPLRKQMRLGWLTEQDQIACIQGDPKCGFVAGESYPLSTRSKVASETQKRVVENRRGEHELRRFTTERKLLEVTVGSHTFDEGNENIQFLTDHFDFPDPGCVATRFPDLVRDRRALLRHIERKNNFEFRLFQIDHLSRLLVRGRGMLAHEQGLGKTLMLMALAEALRHLGADPCSLFVSPQDLGAQWAREAKRFFNRRLEVIRSPAEARRVADRVERGEAGWWWTYFEALSIVGRKKEVLPHRPLKPVHNLNERLVAYKRQQRVLNGQDPTTVPSAPMVPTTRDACPECGNDTASGWDGEVCQGTDEVDGCGYVHRSVYVKSSYSHLTTAFKDGVTCVDEISEIRGEDSLRSKAVRALGRGPHKFGATGTPLSNFLADSYYPIGFSLGFGTPQFPYDHARGRYKFEADFCTIEHKHGREEDDEENVKKNRKILPQITNVSQFWRLAQPSISRCRKEQTGEPLVERMYYPIRVPMGVQQQAQHAFWMDNFPDYFRWKDPTHAFVKKGLVEKYAATLGLLWRLEHASTLPAADEPSRDWPEAASELTDLSNFTPATLKVLEIAMSHAENGEKVLIGSDLVRTGLFLSERLIEKGVKSVHITEERAGKVGTKNPRKRAREVEAFSKGAAQVLCAGVGAMKLGHDLHAASTVIVLGLPYSFMVLDQFLARVHRLSSPKPVSVYVVIPNGSLAVDKWELLKDKGGASDLAFDGELSVQPEEAIDWNEVLRNMKARGIQAAGNEVPETEIEAAWREAAPLRPAFAPRKIRNRPAGSPGLLGPQPVYGQPSLFDLSA